jgi:hypothetical protein
MTDRAGYLSPWEVADSQVRAALEGMRKMLDADGYELEAKVVEGRVLLKVVATPRACEECLVPKGLFASMAADMLQRSKIAVDSTDVALTYPTD